MIAWKIDRLVINYDILNSHLKEVWLEVNSEMSNDVEEHCGEVDSEGVTE